MNRVVYVVSLFALMMLSSCGVASAHVVVKPAQVATAAFQTFTMGVPVEKDIPTIGLRLVIPDGLKYVTPNVKPGWTIAVKKSGEGDSATVTEITWSNGTIPAGQRDDFVFSAQAPANATTLQWKAYQTYADGTVVTWDQAPDAAEQDNAGPYSQTAVVSSSTTGTAATTTLWVVSLVALVASLASLTWQTQRKNIR